ncbi:hypothetical protein PVAND_015802 [Polypedilum vanderplanki]|uniref:Uncharacterized protein n=1 Tax=Polypedilum vanderplanki TaxID=319348 RepID=A0A9J6BD75_POLVA|nr:hypothetical protein PVAND_015802 [Polypedilum vanderplanki]
MALWHNVVAFFHLIVIFHHAIVIHYDFIYISPIEINARNFSFGGRLIYLSVWNMFIQLIYFIMAFINDFIEAKDTHTISYSSHFSLIKNYVFTALAFPLALNVSAMFWLLYFIDRDLVTSKELQEVTPEWYTHMMRTNIMIFVVIEMICTTRKYPKHLWALFGLISFLLTYLSWTVVIYQVTGHWVHPIFNKFNWPQRIGFYGFNIFVPITFYFIGDLINWQIMEHRIKKTKVFKRKRSQKGVSNNRSNQPDLISQNLEHTTEV